MNDKLECIEINPEGMHKATVIWLHGLGADGHDFEPIVPELALPESLGIRFVFPHAPERSVTINGGMLMRAWYDLVPLGEDHEAVYEHMLGSAEQLEDLIKREMNEGISPDRIILAGFSQGGAIVLHTGLRYEERLAGILALSTHLPRAGDLASDGAEINQEVPIFMAHGTMDPMIPLGRAIRTREKLSRLGYQVKWHEYTMEHGVCPEEIREIRSWLIRVLG